MDNAAEALYMGAAVLVFMVALSLTLSSFSTFKNDLEDLILAEEKVDTAQSTDSTVKTSYINYISSSEECRTVGIETVANSIYRVYKENYMVVLKLNDYSKFTDSSGSLKEYKDLLIKGNGVSLNSPTTKANMKFQQYKNSKETKDLLNLYATILVFNIPNAQNNPERFSNLLRDGLYDLLKDKTFIEYTGVYYQNDTVPLGSYTDPKTYPEDEGKKSISVANKEKARIITYIEKEE